MRLISTETLKIQEFGFEQIPEYAILSHRWGQYELTLQDVQGQIWTREGFGNETSKVEAFRKIEQCCARAKSDAFEYAWIDSCCIDKTSSAELSEAINSMYLWYYKSTRCYAFLADVPLTTFEKSEWFERGWTLQELLAPSDVRFVDRDWKDLGTKKSLRDKISHRTRIPVDILSGADLEMATIGQRMSWASHRKTTRVEDRAYSLMGVFGINMPLLYGEGERAFIRLQEEIMKVSNDHSLFAWKSPDTRGGLLATSPDAFVNSNNIVQYKPFSNASGPLTVSSIGIHLELHFIGIGPGGLGKAILHCTERGREDRPLAIYVRDTTMAMERFERVQSEDFDGLDLRKVRTWQYPMRKMCIKMGRMTFLSRAESSEKRNSITKGICDDAMTMNSMDAPDPEELFRAAREGHQDIVWLLLTRSDFKASSKDKSGRTVLWHAMLGRHEALVKMLLARSDVDPDAEDDGGQTPLSWASENGHEAMVHLLLEKGVDIEARYNGQTPLVCAISCKQMAIIRLLLDKGANIEARDNKGRTPLLWAAECGYKDGIQLLLDKGADMEAKDNDGWTPLFWTIRNGNGDTMGLLSEKGADRDEETERQTPLIWAARCGNEAIVKLLLEKDKHLEAQDKDGFTPLIWAASHGQAGMVKLLLDEGADYKVKDNKGRTPLTWAVDHGHVSVAQLLLEKGDDIEARDHERLTPLLRAVGHGHEALVKMLLDRDADVMAKDERGRTPLILAADHGYKNLVQLLIGKGNDMRAKAHRAQTMPLTRAANHGYKNVVQLLKKKKSVQSTH